MARLLDCEVARKIGAGDREHVRTNIVQVGIFSPEKVEQQIAAALFAATELRTRIRIYFNVDLITHEQLEYLNRVTMSAYRSGDHDLMQASLDDRRFFWMVDQLDMTIRVP